MKKLAVLFCLSAVLSLADTWTGVLVDSNCWASEERNVNPADTTTFVDRDRNQEIRACAPGMKTKSFVVVPPDGVGLRLDAAGNLKAADLIRSAARRDIYRVKMSGDLTKATVKTESIVIVN